MMLMPGGCYSATIVILSWATGSLSQPTIKRASAIAIINAISNTPNSEFPFHFPTFSFPLLKSLKLTD
jgi:uncharacterized protein (UPF0147 family)